ncbi:wax ester/triacylglycerol synthase domain-containing protein [Parenemella sanctibonifatiensis]|nr:wax ester/triacylglycerol synthase domain-containing protein [Parenemella sanctibonifatiensis]
MAERVTSVEMDLLARSAHRPASVLTAMLLDEIPTDLTPRISQRLDYVPRYRQLPRSAGLGVHRWRDDPDFTVSRQLHRAEIGTAEDLRTELQEMLGRPWPTDRPLWRAEVVKGEGTAALVLDSHPALVDGHDTVELSQVLLETEPAPGVAIPSAWEPEPMPEGETEFTASLIGGWRDPETLMATAASGLRGLAGRLRGTPPPVAEVRPRLSLAGVPKATLAAACKATGATAEQVLLASVTAAGGRGRRLNFPRSHADDGSTSALGLDLAPQVVVLPDESMPHAALRQVRPLRPTGIDVDALRALPGCVAGTVHAMALRSDVTGPRSDILLSWAPSGDAERWYLGRQKVRAMYAAPVVGGRTGIGICEDHRRLTVTVVSSDDIDLEADDVVAAVRRLAEPE